MQCVLKDTSKFRIYNIPIKENSFVCNLHCSDQNHFDDKSYNSDRE
jgi:hypothetical protein